MRKSSRTISARIHRLTGQLVAIENMIQDKRSCTDVLNQISAVRAGLESVALLVLQKEIQKPGSTKTTNPDLHALLQSFIKST